MTSPAAVAKTVDALNAALPKIPCKQCGYDFVRKVDGQVYCNTLCRAQGRAMNRDRKKGTSPQAIRRAGIAHKDCPKGWKRRYLSSKKAYEFRDGPSGDLSLTAYSCVCRYIHLGHDSGNPLHAASRITPGANVIAPIVFSPRIVIDKAREMVYDLRHPTKHS